MYRGSAIEPPKVRRRPTRLPVVGVLALLLCAMLASCTTNPPRAVLNVPGSYVADLWPHPNG
jgi:type IV pilus biogenesis protein CpaD/CtpE